MHERWQASELHAHRGVLAAIRTQDLSAIYRAIEAWRPHAPLNDPGAVNAALAEIGRNRYGANGEVGPSDWRALRSAYLAARRTAKRRVPRAAPNNLIGDLNPRWRQD